MITNRTPLTHAIEPLVHYQRLIGKSNHHRSSDVTCSKHRQDLTRLESGGETSFNEPFDLQQSIEEATQLYRNEARRRGLVFDLDLTTCPKQVIGDARKIRNLVANLTANALKYTAKGSLHVSCMQFEEPLCLRNTRTLLLRL